MTPASVTLDIRTRSKRRVSKVVGPGPHSSWPTQCHDSSQLPCAGVGWTQLMELPREIRIVEAVCVFIAVLVLMDRSLSRISRRLVICIVLFSFLAVGSHIANPLVSLLDVFRLAYAYILPLLIFIIGREAHLNVRSRELMWRLFLGWVILNVIISWYQFVWLGYPVGDDITGLNKDAHANGNLMFFASLIWRQGFV